MIEPLPDPPLPLESENYPEDYRDRSKDPGQFKEVNDEPACPAPNPDKLRSNEIGEKLPFIDVPPVDIERDVLKWINKYRTNPKSCLTILDKYIQEGHKDFKKEHL
jgi:hypothetical protein